MKLVTYRREANDAVGALVGNTIVPFNPIGDGAGFATMQELVEAGDEALAQIADHLGADPAGIALDAVELLAPLPKPEQIRDVLCFLDHMLNAGRTATTMRGGDATSYEVPEVFRTAPRYYKANRMCVVGHEHDIIWPADCTMLDFELELGIIIGTAGKDIPVESALDHVFGYTIFNDVSARDLQMEEMVSGLGPAKGKDFDTGNVFGPCIATADSIDPTNISVVARLNGEEIGRGNTNQMDHTVAEAISYASKNETLHPGEIIGSGTVPTCCLLEHGRSLSPDDVIELEADGIGILRNRVVAA